jgi:hypothetical protein
VRYQTAVTATIIVILRRTRSACAEPDYHVAS